MVQRFKAHFDGRVFVPDEPVDLPKDQPVEVEAAVPSMNGTADQEAIEARLRALDAITGVFSAPPPSAESLRRESLYDSP
jgi:hypothetical protein